MKDKILFFLVEYLGAAIIWLLGKSLRIKLINDPKEKSTDKVLYAFWHNCMLILAFSHRNQGINVLISQSKDGELIARPLARLGFTTTRGSSTRGGIRALLKMAKLGKEKQVDLAITPDGPKGPKYKAQMGVVLLAQKTGLPLIPVVNIAEKYWQLNSWDSFMIPKPFSRAVILFGDSIRVSPDDDLEMKLAELQEKMDKITEEAENYFESFHSNKKVPK